jgi:hypothetical protein
LSAPQDLDRVLFKGVIGGENDHIFYLRLGDQKAIKGVAMVRGQLRNRERVCVGYR